MSYNDTSDQEVAFNRFIRGENLFITGPGGSGKTYLIKRMVQHMIANGTRYQVCAMTGCAAVLLGTGARTLHSWSGMGLAAGSKDAVVRKMTHHKKASGEMKKVRVLIVDEVSMMSKKIFEVLDTALRAVRHIESPFGGVQVIFTGDFFQLPPVGSSSDIETSMFAFESPRWSVTFPLQNHIVLRHIFRQTDAEYKEILNQIRFGELSESATKTLMKCVKRPVEDPTIVPTKLFAIRAKTEFVNSRMYEKIEGEEHVFKMQEKTDLKIVIDTGKAIDPVMIRICSGFTEQNKKEIIEGLAEMRQIVQELRLKRGARVMCTYNINVDQGICNGSQGVVVDFIDAKPVVLFSNKMQMVIDAVWTQSEDFPCIGISQFPLCLAWALTIHKIQGATLTMAEMDLGDSVFEYGQTYVALSRVKSLDGLYLSAFQPRKIKANPTVREFYRSIPEISHAVGGPGPVPRQGEGTENPFEQYRCPQDEAVVAVSVDNLAVADAVAIPVVEAEVVRDPNVKVIRL